MPFYILGGIESYFDLFFVFQEEFGGHDVSGILNIYTHRCPTVYVFCQLITLLITAQTYYINLINVNLCFANLHF